MDVTPSRGNNRFNIYCKKYTVLPTASVVAEGSVTSLLKTGGYQKLVNSRSFLVCLYGALQELGRGEEASRLCQKVLDYGDRKIKVWFKSENIKPYLVKQGKIKMSKM